MNLILMGRDEVDAGGTAVLRDGRARHVIAVLKATPGQTLHIGIIDGPFGVGTVRAIDRQSVTLRCTLDPETPPRPAVDLLLALPRPKVLRRLWAQLAALGVGRIILTNAARVERNYFDTHVIGEDCYRPLLLEGLQQARDTRVPPVSVHRQFRRLVEDELDGLSDAPVRWMADPQEAPRQGVPYEKGVPDETGRILLAVGPEGGWNDFERELLAARGFAPMSLGTRILRVDTACIALLTIAHRSVPPTLSDSP
ncbi:MAG: 16S rRNA (uracil(1498)-N(3))-methyltransferase [Vicinamibacterales bacterium]